MQEIGKFDVKVSVIPDEKHMVFTNNKDLIFVDSMQCMDSSPNALVNNLSYCGYKYLSQEFSDERLKLVKDKGFYLHEHMNSFKMF